MIDDAALTDPSRCPACGTPLRTTSCAGCGARLDGELGRRIWEASVSAAGLLAERARLVAALRAQTAPVAVPTRPVPFSAGPAGVPARPVETAPIAAAPPRPAPAPKPEWTRHRVQNLLLGLGIALLAAAAVIFVAVSWGSLGVGGRAAVLVGVTALAAAAAHATGRRGLEASSGALALLTVALGLVDAYGARASGLAGLDDAPGTVYWAGATAVIAGLAAAGCAFLPTRPLRISAAVLAQLPVVLLTTYLAQESGHPMAVLATGWTVQALLLLATARAWPLGPSTSDARVVAAVGGALAWWVAVVTGLIAAYAEAGSWLVGAAVLLLLAAVPTAAAVTGPFAAALRPPLTGVATAVAVLAAWAVPSATVAVQWRPLSLALVGLAGLVACHAVPRSWRLAPATVLTAAAVLPAASCLEALAALAAGPPSWLAEPWSAVAEGSSARELLSPYLSWSWGLSMPLVLLTVAAALVAASRLLPLRPALEAIATAVAATALLAAPLALDAGYLAAVGATLGVGLVLLLGGEAVVRAGRPAPGWSAVAMGSVSVLLAAFWSLAVEEVTLATWAVAATVLLLAVAGAVGFDGARRLRAVLAVGAGVAAAAEAGALTRHIGGGWAAVWTVTLSTALVLVLALAAARVMHVQDRQSPADRAAVIAAGVLALADVAAFTWWLGGTPAECGLAVTVAAAVLFAAVAWSPLTWQVGDALPVAALGLAAGLAGAADDADRLWLALLAAGVGTGVAAARPGRHWLGWLSGVLLAASSWVRLAMAGVEAPEAYTVPSALALLAVGAARRHRDPGCRSWVAYAPGLSLALVPSLIRALTDDGTARPLLLGLAALAVLLAGVARRLQAPLVIGGAVLGTVVAVQLSPYLADLYAATPRWVSIAAAGLLLLVVGTTYESRVRDLRRIQQRIEAFE